jgi:hypothetical protein
MGRLIFAYHEISDAPSHTNAFYELAPALRWLEEETAVFPPITAESMKKAI